MQDDVRFANNGDVTLAYLVRGEGPVDLVWTNIWYSHLDLLDAHPQVAAVGEALSRFARVVQWDRRGAGLSDRLPGPATLEEGVDDLLAVMDAAEIERATLFGFNESAMLCSLAAATHPDRFSSLIIYGGFATTTRQDDYPWGQEPEDRALQVQYLCTNWATPEVAQMMLMTEDEALISWGVRWQRNSVSRDALPAFYDMLGRTDVRQVLPSIKVPTLILHRKEDQVIHPDNGRYLADHIPGARFVELDGFQHPPFMGDWEQLVD
ncbi:MAG: alpha/beta fold hydrolase, partial [Actinomycetota bacterium]